MKIATAGEFGDFVNFKSTRGNYTAPRAFGIGFATLNSKGDPLDTWYPVVNHQENYGSAAVFAEVLGYTKGHASYRISPRQIEAMLEYFAWTEGDGKKHGNVEVLKNAAALLGRAGCAVQNGICVYVCFIPPAESDMGPGDVPDSYLRLHLLSHRKVRPHGIDVKGIFGRLPNNVWTNEGPIWADDLPARIQQAMMRGDRLTVHSHDKFPRMLDYVVLPNVRIADASRVRLGAYLGDGVVVMHEGFVNFNAGAEGPNMVEGRISAGVFVHAGTDIGGGASIMGTLSGGGTEVISVGHKCLIGANGGIGISLGDNCTVEAGLYVTAGMKVMRPDGKVVKAKTLSGDSNMTFIRESRTGQVIMRAKANTVELNEELHKS